MTVYDQRPRADLEAQIGSLEDRAVDLRLGPDVDPAEVLRDQALITTSPAVSSRFNTTEPRLRAALAEVEAAGGCRW